VFLLCLLVSGFVATDLFMNGPLMTAFAFVLATSTALPYCALLLWFDRNEQEPVLLVLTAFMWGAVVATAVSLVVNTAFGAAMMGVTGDAWLSGQLTASFSAPFIEELTKGAAVMFLFLLFRRDFDNVLDGMLYGALVGLGFAWFENVLYYVRAGEGGVTEMLKLTYLRGFLNGISSHVAYTGLTGLGFGLVRVMRKGVLRWAFVPLFWGMAMFAHFMWNTFVGPLIYATGATSETVVYLVSLPIAVLVLQSPFVLLLLGVALLVWRHERRLIVKYLDAEPDHVVHPDEVRTLVPARRRAWNSARRFLSHGPLTWWRYRGINSDLIKLAFVKWHHDRDDEIRWTVDQDADVISLRDRIRRRRARIGST
jgi:RsiW-degrading membrane proteinase PrsW (M82 family)